MVVALCAMTAGAHAQLSSGDRAKFIARARTSCERSVASQPLLEGASRRSFASLCGCAARKIADSTDYSDFWLRRPGQAVVSPIRPEDIPAPMQDLIQESLSECLQERGNYIPGATVTPNR
jgi:hypothetical protein